MANFVAAALNALGDSNGRTDHIEMQQLIGDYFGSPGNDSSDEGRPVTCNNIHCIMNKAT